MEKFACRIFAYHHYRHIRNTLDWLFVALALSMVVFFVLEAVMGGPPLFLLVLGKFFLISGAFLTFAMYGFIRAFRRGIRYLLLPEQQEPRSFAGAAFASFWAMVHLVFTAGLEVSSPGFVSTHLTFLVLPPAVFGISFYLSLKLFIHAKSDQWKADWLRFHKEHLEGRLLKIARLFYGEDYQRDANYLNALRQQVNEDIDALNALTERMEWLAEKTPKAAEAVVEKFATEE